MSTSATSIAKVPSGGPSQVQKWTPETLCAPTVELDAPPEDYAIAQARLCQNELEDAPSIPLGSIYETRGLAAIFEAPYEQSKTGGMSVFQSYAVGPFIPIRRMKKFTCWVDGKLIVNAPTLEAAREQLPKDRYEEDIKEEHLWFGVFPDSVCKGCVALRCTSSSLHAAKDIFTFERERAENGDTFGEYTLKVGKKSFGSITYFRFTAVTVADPSKELSGKAALWRKILCGQSVSVVPAPGEGPSPAGDDIPF